MADTEFFTTDEHGNVISKTNIHPDGSVSRYPYTTPEQKNMDIKNRVVQRIIYKIKTWLAKSITRCAKRNRPLETLNNAFIS